MRTPSLPQAVPRPVFNLTGALALGLALSLTPHDAPAAENKAGGTLADLSIEQLMNESVTSVAKKETRLAESPAAIAVLTQTDIRQSGRTTLPELLRLVPGVEVSQNGAHEWAVGVRGFGDELSRKLQVLLDGRTVYSTAVGGVHWDVQDVFLDDLERIEVIRGPGATLWGANAVNGVINVISKNARDTQGDLATITYGRDDRPEVMVRHGGQLAPKIYYRASVKYFHRAGMFEADGSPRDDAWSAWHTGFRIDGEPSTANTFTLQGDYFHGRFHEPSVSPRLTAPFSTMEQEVSKDTGSDVLGRWTHRFVDAGQLIVQAYYDRVSEATPDEREAHDIYDFDAQYQFALGARHELVAGAGWRFIHDTLTPSPELSIAETHADERHFNVFLQDSIALVPERLTLTLGSKVEHTPFTGFEYQPSGRILWRASERQTAWAAVSRAVRTPTRVEQEGTVLTEVEPPGVAHLEIGNPDLKSEELVAYEIGYRITPEKRVSIDATAFLNEYRKLVAFEEEPGFLTTTPPPPHRVEPSVAQNSAGGRNWGVELASQWQVTPRWRLHGSYSWLRSRISHDLDRDTPEHQFVVSTHVDLGANWAWDSSLNYFSHVSQSDTRAYTRWDMGLTWRPHPSLELKVFGQNLSDRRHVEYEHEDLIASIPRSVYGKLTWRF